MLSTITLKKLEKEYPLELQETICSYCKEEMINTIDSIECKWKI